MHRFMKETKFIQLINPPIPANFLGSSKQGCYPPLGLISLASYLKVRKPSIDIEILDGEILSMKEIMERISSDFVGVSANFVNYSNALKIIECAKNRGSITVLGGPHTYGLADTILKNRPMVDFVIRGEGEESLLLLLSGKPLKQIPNLSYRLNGSFIHNPIQPVNFNALPIPDLGLVPMKEYFDNFYRKFGGFLPATRAGLIYSQRGCAWKDKTGGCIYCRAEGKYKAKNPIRVWDEIRFYVTHYHIDFFWDCSDSFTMDKKWLREFGETKLKDLNPYMMVYSRPTNINAETVLILKKINCVKVLFGADSGSDYLLKVANTAKSTQAIKKAANLLRINGIWMSPSFVLGFPGESFKTLNETLDLIRFLINLGNCMEISLSLLYPVPGSWCFSQLLRARPYKYKNKDSFDLVEIQRDWMNIFCDVSYNEIVEFLKEKLLPGVPLLSSFGLQNSIGYSNGSGLIRTSKYTHVSAVD